jgi:hypothetical protein
LPATDQAAGEKPYLSTHQDIPMRSLGLMIVFFACNPLQAQQSISYPAKPGPGQGKTIVFLCGDEEYRGEEALPMLGKILSQKHGFAATVLFPLNPDGTINPDLSNLGDPEAIDKAEMLVLALRFRNYPDAIMKRIDDAMKRGIPVIGLRTSTHAFRGVKGTYAGYNNFGRNVLGENWVSHWGPNRQGLTKASVEPAAQNDPLLRGVGPIFGDSGVYETHPVADATILLRGVVLKGMQETDPPADYKKKRASDKVEQPVNDPAMPIAWKRLHKQDDGKTSRVFCTTMGAATDFRNENLRRLVVNAVYEGFNLTVPEKADVEPIDAYKPSAYAFKGYRRGITPSDHALGKELPVGQPIPPKK